MSSSSHWKVLSRLRIREFQDEITRLKMQLEKRGGGPGSPPRPPPQEGEEVVVETEVVEVEKSLEVNQWTGLE